jgi:hypothetical protein
MMFVQWEAGLGLLLRVGGGSQPEAVRHRSHELDGVIPICMANYPTFDR